MSDSEFLTEAAQSIANSKHPSPQKPNENLLDQFSRSTRLKPALLVILPIAGAVAAIGLSYSVVMGVVAAPLAAAGATLLLAQIGRDFGSRKQPYLFGLWEGKPSTSLLRHRDERINAITKARYHAVLARILNTPAPTVEEERKDPKSADVSYEAFGDLLRERTRDTKAFPLVYQELMNYDFRRNLWGMKPLAISIAGISIAIQLLVVALALSGRANRPQAADVAFLLVDVLLLGCWLFIIKPDWVRVAADAYAERLLAASERM